MTILISYVLFLIIAVISIVYAFKKIIKPGVSKEVRKTVMCRFITYIAILNITFWLYGYKIVTEGLLDKPSSEQTGIDYAANMLFAS